MSFFSRWFGEKVQTLNKTAQRDAIVDILLFTLAMDRDAHKDEVEQISHIVTRRYELDRSYISERMAVVRTMSVSDIEGLAKQFCASVDGDDRVLLLRDMWAMARANGEVSRAEEAIFYRVGRLLELRKDFIDKVIKD